MAPFVGRRHIVSSGHKLSRGRLEARLELPSFLPSRPSRMGEGHHPFLPDFLRRRLARSMTPASRGRDATLHSD